MGDFRTPAGQYVLLSVSGTARNRRRSGGAESGEYSDGMTKWEYATVPLIVHATKQILDQWGEDGWELVQVVPGPDGNSLVAYLKRQKEQ